jgi:16S rRNA (cytosine967-C5)-methyltransferase
MNDRDETTKEHPGADTRAIAIRVVHEVGAGARTATALHAALLDVELDPRDRAFVTELAHGSVRMQRPCDLLIDRHASRAPDAEVRAVLRVGVYQLVFLGTPPHAAVSATVAATRPKVRGFVNAVLRRVAEEVARGGEWPTVGDELSYPDWLIDSLINDLGEADALEALAAMNNAEQAAARADGYVQGGSSVAVVNEVEAAAGDLVIDLCAAPGGKTTGIAAKGAIVVGVELSAARVAQFGAACERFGAGRALAVHGDASKPPIKPGVADHVLVDAPCSGLGALGRRSDARWRIGRNDATRLAGVQLPILVAAYDLVKPGGSLVYSVCTMTNVETTGVVDQFEATCSAEQLQLVDTDFWRPLGHGGLVLPHDHGTDGMAVFRWRKPV